MLSSRRCLAGLRLDRGSQCFYSEDTSDVLVQLAYLSSESRRCCGGFPVLVVSSLLLLVVARLCLVLKLSLQVGERYAVLGVVFRRHVTPESYRRSAGCFSSALLCPVGPLGAASCSFPEILSSIPGPLGVFWTSRCFRRVLWYLIFLLDTITVVDSGYFSRFFAFSNSLEKLRACASLLWV